MRSLAEWLVLPLLLLPVLAGIGLVLWAQGAHHRAQAAYREDGAATVEAWLREDGSAGWMPERVIGFAASLPSDLVPFGHPVAGAVVRLPAEALGTEPWSFTADLPSPLSPALLTEPGVRLGLETGLAPVDVEGAAEGAVALRALLEAPDLARLRTAPLPPATKRYVLARWRRQGAQGPALDEADVFLSVVECFTGVVGERETPLPPGEHRVGDLDVLAFGPTRPALVVVPSVQDLRLSRLLFEVGLPESPARLSWRFPRVTTLDDAVLWQGRIETPLAGTFTFQARWQTWWQAPWVKRWIGPVVALLLAAFLLPVALLVSIRKRRLLDEARVRFLNEMAHDLRTPLASLRLHADMLSEGRGKPEKRSDYLHLLSREAARLSSLLANLLDLSRLEQGRRRLETGTIDVGALVYRAARELVLLHPDRAEDLHVEGPEKTWAKADTTALSRSLANLLENAGKFTASGTPIRVSWSIEGTEVRVRVADEGPGIPEGERRRVFERYARGKAARRDGVPGTGLGLSLVKELVEGMGGTVALLPGEVGAVFEIRLPGVRS